MIASNLIDHHRLPWLFRFDGAVVRFGLCSHKRATIYLSSPLTLLNSEEQVIDTILHEIAHALAPVTSGHDCTWQTIARSIGCDGKRCYTAAVIAPPKPWIGTCPGCRTTVERHHRKRIACSACCHGKFNPQFIFTWKKSEEGE